ncbi:MAG: hypothetical protein WC516_06245 [Patescibacteria group bacterium]|jgi:hypothetical protein
MPYVKDRRKELDKIVKLMNKKEVLVNGDLNYILFKFCKYHIAPSYNNYKQFLGELDCCKLEIYRRLVAPYENKKIEENGDV